MRSIEGIISVLNEGGSIGEILYETNARQLHAPGDLPTQTELPRGWIQPFALFEESPSVGRSHIAPTRSVPSAWQHVSQGLCMTNM